MVKQHYCKYCKRMVPLKPRFLFKEMDWYTVGVAHVYRPMHPKAVTLPCQVDVSYTTGEHEYNLENMDI